MGVFSCVAIRYISGYGSWNTTGGEAVNQVFTTGAVALKLRTPAPELQEVRDILGASHRYEQ